MNLFNQELWEKLHGFSTHFPLALVFTAAILDFLGLVCSPKDERKRDLHAGGYYTILVALFGSVPAMVSGVFMTHGVLLGGNGALFWHHLFVLPGFTLLVGLTVWRWSVGREPASGWLAVYLFVLVVTAGLMLGGGFWGAELLEH